MVLCSFSVTKLHFYCKHSVRSIGCLTLAINGYVITPVSSEVASTFSSSQMMDSPSMGMSHSTDMVQQARATAVACRELVQCATDLQSQLTAVAGATGESGDQQWSQSLLHTVRECV